MFRPRVIPVLLLQDLGLVKTRSFKNRDYIGDPINAVKIFNNLKADELIFLDILASKEKRSISLDFVRNVGSEANMPFAVGGGVSTIEDIRNIISAGAEKVIITSHALENPDFIRQASDYFGSSTVSVCMDVKETLFKKQRVWSHRKKRSSRFLPVEFAKLMEEKGAGELIVQSVNLDGQMTGYDIRLIRQISEVVSIPVVALGGAGQLSHLKDAYQDGYASSMGAGSLFVYQSLKRGVLINYPSRAEIRELF